VFVHGCSLSNQVCRANDGGRIPNTGSEQRFELVRGHWSAEQISLRFIALVILEESQLFRCLDALGNDPQLEASGHADNRGDNRRVLSHVGDLTDERLVDF
jgi:hypothetical protein